MTGQRPPVTLDRATPADATLLSNLLELYIHDMSAVFTQLAIGPDGRFGYSRLPLYWSEPDRRFPFLIRCDGKVAGFVLAKRGSPASDDPTVLDIEDFFVMRQYRRSGVGRDAAFLVWRHLPGTWTVRVAEGNRGALAFWTDVITEFSHGTATQVTRPGNPPITWRIFSFESRQWMPNDCCHPEPTGEGSSPSR